MEKSPDIKGQLLTNDTDQKSFKADVMFGIYSSVSKKFVFGIEEPSRTKAWRALFHRIGDDAWKWRFEVRKIRRSRN